MPHPEKPLISIENITDNLYRITLPMPFRLRPVNIAALVHERGVALFDTGMNLGHAFPALEGSLKKIGRSIEDIDHIFITHCHADHCGLAGKIKAISGAAIHMSESGRQILRDNHDHARVADRVRTFYMAQGMAEDKVDTYLIFLRYFRQATVPFEVDECLAPHTKYVMGGTEFEAVPTPGHARDHVCYFFPSEGILLAGDHLLPENLFNLRPDLFCPDFRPAQAMIDSLARVENLPVTRVVPSHGDSFSNLAPVAAAMKRIYGEKKRRIRSILREEPGTALQISEELFGGNLPGFDGFLALNETYAHLMELRHEGIIRESRSNGHYVYTAHC